MFEWSGGYGSELAQFPPMQAWYLAGGRGQKKRIGAALCKITTQSKHDMVVIKKIKIKSAFNITFRPV